VNLVQKGSAPPGRRRLAPDLPTWWGGESVLGLDVVAGSLSPALVERYLELKERALL
jgi:hypothetical protein